MRSFWFLLLSLWLPTAARTATTPAFSRIPLTDQAGHELTLENYRDRFVLLSFIFTRCPMPRMCPLTLQLNLALEKAWKAKGARPPLQLVLITLDPTYDTPDVLSRYGRRHGLDFDHFTLATGAPERINHLASEFNVIGFPNPSGAISHNVKSILLGPGGREMKTYSDNAWSPEEVLQAIRKPAERKAAPTPAPPPPS